MRVAFRVRGDREVARKVHRVVQKAQDGERPVRLVPEHEEVPR